MWTDGDGRFRFGGGGIAGGGIAGGWGDGGTEEWPVLHCACEHFQEEGEVG